MATIGTGFTYGLCATTASPQLQLGHPFANCLFSTDTPCHHAWANVRVFEIHSKCVTQSNTWTTDSTHQHKVHICRGQLTVIDVCGARATSWNMQFLVYNMSVGCIQHGVET